MPTPQVDAELLVGHVLGLSRGRSAGEGGHGCTGRARRRMTRSIASSSSAGPPASRCSTSPGARRSAASSSRSAPGCSCRGPRRRASRSSRSTHSAPSAAPEPIAVDLGTGQRRDRARDGRRGAARAGGRRRGSPTAFMWTKRNFREIGAGNAHDRVRRPRDALPELDGTVDVVISNPPYIPARHGAARPRGAPARPRGRALRRRGRPGCRCARSRRPACACCAPAAPSSSSTASCRPRRSPQLLTADGWRAIAGHRDAIGRDRATTALR